MSNKNTVFSMIKSGWNLNEIRDLFKQSKEMEKKFVLEKKYDDFHKIIDFSNVKLYYCFKCKCFHKKYRYVKANNRTSIKVQTESFKKCKDNALLLSDTEVFNFKLKRNLNNYSVKAHKLTRGSRKQ